MKYRDYYKILNISRNASTDAIKKAYRRLARKYHPDVSREPNAEEHFKEASEAYEVLRDPEKRAAYDRLGSNWQANQEFRPPPNWQRQKQRPPKQPFAGNNFSDFFESLFGHSSFGHSSQHSGFSGMGGFTGHDAAASQDKTITMEITLEETFHGANRTLHLQMPKRNANGQTTTQTRTLNVKIPAGITTGQKIRLSGQGNTSKRGGAQGDLYLEISIRSHPLYTLEGRNIILDVPLTPWEAALGCKIEVPTLGGSVSLNIPANARSGQKMRLRGRGLPGQPAGDQLVVLQIHNPPINSEKAREIFQHMERTLPFNPRAHWHS
ncbi:MAG: cytochrome C biogenesis protein [Candidatus Contendobacter odensis]|uniref:Cytochrome C biogenesis protein n=1 Tax=Candidatus Contendibacter odensensis TaxID=1400860 RepID=A0A2G6PEI1_9GAMM|nr:MAG: cytochrome C biogenesis protein [Candidatus Contendobacter odensis]